MGDGTGGISKDISWRAYHFLKNRLKRVDVYNEGGKNTLNKPQISVWEK
jgi:hypothetical protein